MKNITYVLCEIIFKDHISGILTSRIGKINESQLTRFSTNLNDFIIFKEHYNSPILKEDIIEIIIYQNDRKIAIKKKNSTIIKYLITQKKCKIS